MAAQVCRFAHYNGTATTSLAPVPLTKQCYSIKVYNKDATNDLLISFDGRNTFTVPHGNTSGNPFTMEGLFRTLFIASSASTVAYEILVTQG